MAYLLIAAIAITYFLFKLLRRKIPNKPYKYLAFIPTLLLIYSFWTAIYPTEDFYEYDYKEVTKLEFPKESEFVYKSATFPDHFGDYTSIFMFKTTEEECDKLEAQLVSLKFQRIAKDNWHSPDTREAISEADSRLSRQYSYETEISKSYYVALFDDHKTILVRRISW